jgi:hypothetical protein
VGKWVEMRVLQCGDFDNKLRLGEKIISAHEFVERKKKFIVK